MNAGGGGLIFRQDYFDDPAAWAAFKTLLSDIFDIDISPLDRLGGPDTTSMPSAFFDAEGRCVANLSAFSLPLTIEGNTVKAAGLQSGAVRPDYRGRGLFRDLIRRTLSRCDAQGFEAVLLYTDKPALYAPHGFVVLPQHRFCGPPPAKAACGPCVRRLDMSRADDLALMRRLLAGRTPVSNRFAALRQTEMFLLNAFLQDGIRLDFLEAYSAAIAWREGENGLFEFLDIAGEAIPSLGEVLAALDIAPPTHVEVFFPPDRLDWTGRPERETGDTVLMIRCADASKPVGPSRLSLMAEF